MIIVVLYVEVKNLSIMIIIELSNLVSGLDAFTDDID